MPIDPARVKALFQQAIDIDDPETRRAFLDREAGVAGELRARLDALLDAFEQASQALAGPPASDATATFSGQAGARTDPDATSDVKANRPSSDEAATPADSPDEAVSPPDLTADWSDQANAARRVATSQPLIGGRYRILQEIGEGGMGSVYLADQVQPVKRQVALKLIKPGMDSRQVLARFESERQALALMDHPNIAKVLDAGTTDSGRPFFVMELVKGIPLTDYCDRHRLDMPTRLQLFRQICSAVQHAHQKGIIHRDLKPSNILVESHDDKPVPKVIDFGLAKATSGLQLTENSLQSAFGSVAGTPLYMAPEQATFNAIDVDTRADIYALGVVLYELLTGSTPITKDSLRRAALDEMLRVIREQEPPPPSNRLSGSDALPSIAANRHAEPAQLRRFVRGDLDWIVMKALAKERSRRYDSAIGLANDVERFLLREPVSAGPPTASYRLRKFVSRNRGRVVAAGIILLAMVAGIAGTTLGLFEARRQAEYADTQRQKAEDRLARMERLSRILGTVFRDIDLRQAEREGKPLAALLGDRLDEAASEVELESADEPLTVARMLLTMSKAQHNLGESKKAIDLAGRAHGTYRKLLGPDHPDTIASLSALADGYHAFGQLDLAFDTAEEVLRRSTSALGPDHPETLARMSSLAEAYSSKGQIDDALKLTEQALKGQVAALGPDHHQTLLTMHHLGNEYSKAGQLEQARELRKETLARREAKLGPDHPDTLASMSNLASSLYDVGEFDQALKLREETLERMRARLGPDHPYTIHAAHTLAISYFAAGRYHDAVKQNEYVLQRRKARLGPDHPQTLGTMNNLGSSYDAAGQGSLALKLREETLERRLAKFGPDHPDTLGSMSNLADSYFQAGRIDRALELVEEALERRADTLGPDHPNTLLSMSDVIDGYIKAGRYDQARELSEKLLDKSSAKLGPEHPDTLHGKVTLGEICLATGQLDRALMLLEEALRSGREKHAPDNPYLLGNMSSLANALAVSGQIGRAKQLFEEILRIRAAKFVPDSPFTLGTNAGLACLLRDIGEYDRAEAVLDGLVSSWRKLREDGHPEILAARLERANLDLARGRIDVDDPAYRKILEEGVAKLDHRHLDALLSEARLAASLRKRGEPAAAVVLYRAAASRYRRIGGDAPPLGRALAGEGAARLALKQWAEAEAPLREALGILDAAPDEAAAVRSLLGASLLGQENHDEAGPLLRAGYEGLKRKDRRGPADDWTTVREALDRLIAWCEAAGDADEARRLEGERAGLDGNGEVEASGADRR